MTEENETMPWWAALITVGVEIIKLAVEGSLGHKTEAEARAECLAKGYLIPAGEFADELAKHEEEAAKR